MLVNEFKDRVFNCAGTLETGYQCIYQSDLAAVGKIRGAAILEAFNYNTGLEAEWPGIMDAMIFGYMVLDYLVLVIKNT